MFRLTLLTIACLFPTFEAFAQCGPNGCYDYWGWGTGFYIGPPVYQRCEPRQPVPDYTIRQQPSTPKTFDTPRTIIPPREKAAPPPPKERPKYVLLSDYQDNVKKQNDNFTHLDSQLKALEKQVSDLVDSNNNIVHSINQINTKIEKVQMPSNTSEVNDLASSISDLRQQISDLKKTLSVLQASRASTPDKMYFTIEEDPPSSSK